MLHSVVPPRIGRRVVIRDALATTKADVPVRPVLGVFVCPIVSVLITHHRHWPFIVVAPADKFEIPQSYLGQDIIIEVNGRSNVKLVPLGVAELARFVRYSIASRFRTPSDEERTAVAHLRDLLDSHASVVFKTFKTSAAACPGVASW